jgi:nucleoside-diphosphate-sugar epimerase
MGKVLDLIKVFKNTLEKKENFILKTLKSGDVKITNADISKSSSILGYYPEINIETGLGKFIDWYLGHK